MLRRCCLSLSFEISSCMLRWVIAWALFNLNEIFIRPCRIWQKSFFVICLSSISLVLSSFFMHRLALIKAEKKSFSYIVFAMFCLTFSFIKTREEWMSGLISLLVLSLWLSRLLVFRDPKKLTVMGIYVLFYESKWLISLSLRLDFIRVESWKPIDGVAAFVV